MAMTELEKPGFTAPESSASEAAGTPTPLVTVVVMVTERPVSLTPFFEEYSAPLEQAGFLYEFLFVVAPWGASLAEPLRPLIEGGARIRVLEVSAGLGESGMLRAARERSRGDVLVTLPAYRRIGADQLPELVRCVLDGADLATARRDDKTNSFVNRLQNRMFHRLLRLTVGVSFRDVASGVRAMRAEVLDEVPVYGDFFRFLPVLVERAGFRVEEVTVARHADDARARVYAPGVYVRRLIDLLGLTFLVRFVRKPLRFFGLTGAATSGIGAVILLVLFFQRLGGQELADRPLLLLGVLLFVVGVQSIGIGLVGEIIVHLSAGSDLKEYRIQADDPR